jgi:DNA-binding NarL/FixJ family response regulator
MLQAVSIVTQEKPQLLIIELQPGMDILGLVRKVKASLSTIRIIALHGIEDSRAGLEALSSGIDGMVLTHPAGSRAACRHRVSLSASGERGALSSLRRKRVGDNRLSRRLRGPDPRSAELVRGPHET